jgi:hypothetical protein
MNTKKVIKILTLVSSSIAASLAGLATLPIPSEEMVLPPQWRPYLVSIAFFAGAIRIVLIPALEAAIKTLNEPDSQAVNPPPKPEP